MEKYVQGGCRLLFVWTSIISRGLTKKPRRLPSQRSPYALLYLDVGLHKPSEYSSSASNFHLAITSLAVIKISMALYTQSTE